MERIERRVLAATVVVAVTLTTVMLVGLHLTAGSYIVRFGAVSF